MTHLILVRHGETDWNRQHRYQGQTDVPLNYTGREQAMRLAGRLTNERFDAIYSSDLLRARETAEIVAAHRPLDIQFDPRLREMHFGVFEGLTYDAIKTQYPDELIAWEDDRRTPPPEGESLAALVTRIQSFLDDCRTQHNAERLLVVAHGGPLRVLTCLALGLPPEQQWQLRMDNTAWSELTLYESGAILARLNDTCHLHY